LKTRYLSTAVLLTSALVLTGCGSGGSDTAGSSDSPAGTSATSTKGNDADISFLTGMKPHHEQAVEMSEMVLAANPPAEVAAVATQIKGAQAPEIEQMNTMLADLGQKSDGAAHGGGHSSGAGHGGMMSDQMMAELDGATGTEAARLYLEGMVLHHEGAIEASDAELKDGKYEPALTLAREIKQAQAAEITAMQALLGKL